MLSSAWSLHSVSRPEVKRQFSLQVHWVRTAGGCWVVVVTAYLSFCLVVFVLPFCTTRSACHVPLGVIFNKFPANVLLVFPQSEEEPQGREPLPCHVCQTLRKIGKEIGGVMVNKTYFEWEMECRPGERQTQLILLECNCWWTG